MYPFKKKIMNAYNVENVAEIKVSYKPTCSNNPLISCSQDAFNVLRKFIPNETIALQEHFLVMFLNNSNMVLGVYMLSKGGITSTSVDPRLILATALQVAATGMILCHNHPSGNLKPSEADKMLTRKLTNAAAFMDIKIADHIIISGRGDEYLSFEDEGIQ